MKKTLINPAVAIITPIFNRAHNLEKFFNSLSNIDYDNYKIIIIDDASTDGSDSFIRKNYPDTVILKTDGNYWWAGSTNVGIRWALQNRFEYILTYNDDQICDPLFLSNLVRASIRHEKSVCSSHIFYLNEGNKLLSGGINIDYRSRRVFGVYNEKRITSTIPNYQVDCVPGYSVLYPRRVFEELGNFDNKNFPQIFMELDFCMRLKKAGFNIIVVTDSIVWNDRSDKNNDPIPSNNFFKRLFWFVNCNKSSLNYLQNKSLFSLLFKDSSLNSLVVYNIFLFWLRYVVKLFIFSILNKPQRAKVKKFISVNADFWA